MKQQRAPLASHSKRDGENVDRKLSPLNDTPLCGLNTL